MRARWVGTVAVSMVAAAVVAGPPGSAPAPLFENLGTYHRAVTTSSARAQRYFDQGLVLFYAFNLAEAQRSFAEAARLDPGCASCWWGVGMSLGPHINLPAQADRTRAGHQAALRALAVADKATPVERDLVAALARRYSDPPPADAKGQRALDEAYAAAMREVARRFPQDDDVGALFAEALMNLRPWDLWSHEGEPRPETPEVLAALEAVLARSPRHPAANHYYIHAVEASAHPEKALAAAQRLGGLAPAAGHLVHMPAHIFMRMGRYEEAAEANRRAIVAEDAYIEKAKPEGFHWMYVAHNPQFLMAAAAMQGRSAEALAAARRAVGYLGPEMLRHMPGLDLGLAYPQWTLVRFGRWDEVLGEAAPPADFPFAVAMWHAARALAFSAKGNAGEAERARGGMAAAAAAVPADATEGLNPASRLLAIASGLTGGELALRAGRGEDGVRQLQEAVRQEDALNYDEPSDWYYPARHHLGAALLALGRAADAQAVYEEDLRRSPENGWALLGLAESLRAAGRLPEAAAARVRFAKAWERADVALAASRF